MVLIKLFLPFPNGFDQNIFLIPNVLDQTGERISITNLYHIKDGVLEPLSHSNPKIASKNQKISKYTSVEKVLRSAIVNSYMKWGHDTWKKIILSN